MRSTISSIAAWTVRRSGHCLDWGRSGVREDMGGAGVIAMHKRLKLGMVGGGRGAFIGAVHRMAARLDDQRSEEHTSELQSLMRISYAVFCLKKKHTTHEDK